MGDKNISFSDCVRHLYIPKLNQVEKIASCGLKDWLCSSDHYIVTESSDNYIKIIYFDETDLLSAWANDISRLSCAFLESVANINESEVNDKFLAWNLVQYYYSAFYSAHTIIKILGFGLIHFDSVAINELHKKADIIGTPWSAQISKGIYCIQFDIKNNMIVLYNIKRYDDSHRGLWKRFLEVICIIIGKYVTTNTYGNSCIRIKQPSEAHPLSLFDKIEYRDAIDAVSRLEELESILNVSGDSNWLSGIRNQINYNHGLGSWYPYKGGSNCYDRVVKLKDLYLTNFLSEKFNTTADDKVIKYVKTCQLINSINFDILCDMRKRNSNGKSFLQDYVFRYYSEYCRQN